MKKFLLLFLLLNAGLKSQVVHVKWSWEAKKHSDCEYDLVFKAKIDKYYHTFSIEKSGDSRPTSFTFAPSQDYELVGKMKEPKPHRIDDEIMGVTLEHDGPGVFAFTQRIRLLSNKKIKIKGQFEYQECDTVSCVFPPNEDFSIEVQGNGSCEAATEAGSNPGPGVITVKTDSIKMGKPDTAAARLSSEPHISEAVYDTEQTNLTWWVIFLQGLAGGFIALLTPCVFPMIPMNVSFFTKQSKTKRQGLRNALLYAIFLIVLYVGLGLGVTLIFGAGALHTLSTNIWFNLAFFLLLVIFAISFLGAFEIVLPSSFVNKMDARSDRGGILGIFFMAFTLALVSFSCTGPIIGTLLVQAAATGDLTNPFWGMFGFSLALALPFGFFAAFPGWLNSLPKSGGWLNSVKVVLGFLELALALKFASNADMVYQYHIIDREVFVALWIVIFTLQGIYLLGGFKTAHDTDLKHVSVTRLFFAIGSFFVAIYLLPGMWGAPLKIFSGILPEQSYSESPHGFGGNSSAGAVSVDPDYDAFIETSKTGVIHFKNNYDTALAYARKTGKPLFVDFTGFACANCRKTEDNVWPDPEVLKKLNNDVVLVSLYVDDKRALPPNEHMSVFWYGRERTITDIGDKFKYMEETRYGQSTQPLYVMLDHNEKLLVPVRGYNPSIPAYLKWINEGVEEFKNRKTNN
jgi:thiol:disulfide interchange protein